IRSRYFREKILSSEYQPGQTIELKDVSTGCFRTFLHSIYIQQPPQDKLSFELLLELAKYSKLTEVDWLFKWCERELANMITHENFCKIAIHADKIRDEALLTYCKYWTSEQKEFASGEDLSVLDVTDLMDRLDLSCNFNTKNLQRQCIDGLNKALSD